MSSPTATATATETIMLVMVAIDANNNKFYEATLDGDTVTVRYGRVGNAGVTMTYVGGRRKFDSLVASKTRKGYRKVDRVTDVSSGSSKADLVGVARKRLLADQADARLTKIVTNWCAANRHQIETTSGGKMQVTDTGAVTTALGMVSAASLTEARALLPKVGTGDRQAVESYMTLVPQAVGTTRGWEERFTRPEEIARQRDFLDALDGSLALAASVNAGGDAPDAHFRYKLTSVDPSAPEYAEIAKRFTDSRNGMHTSSGMKLSGLFAVEVEDAAEAARWKGLADKLGNVRRLWHGTNEANLLSLMHRGFVVPAASGRGSTIQVTGRMFGDGVYLSDQSTKSLNYSQGYWSGGRRANHCFMLVVDAVMGTTFKPQSYGGSGVAGSRDGRHHSITVKGGTAGVRNNEMVVWNTDQLRISYVCEFTS